MAVSTSTANDLMTVFSNTIDAGFAALSGPVNAVFGTLIALVVGLTGIQWAVSPNRELLAGAFSKVLLIGAFAWLINDWQSLSQTIYAGFLQLGLQAGGGSVSQADFLNPGAVLEQGWTLVKAIGAIKTNPANPLDVAANLLDALILGVGMIGVMLSFAVLALQIIVTLLEFKIVTLGGFVLLPFGVWTKSAFLAERPLGYVVAAGLKVLALAIVVSGAITVFSQITPSADPDIYEALSILVAAMLLALLALYIPSLAASLVTGGPSLAAGSAVTGGLAVAGAGALAGAAAVGAGSAGASMIANGLRSAAGAGGGRPPPPPGSPPPPPMGPGSFGPTSGGPAPSGAAAQAAPGAGAGADAGSARPSSFRANPSSGSRAGSGPGSGGPPSDGGDGEASPKRAAAFRAYFAANAARGLLPANENAGTLHPDLKREEH